MGVRLSKKPKKHSENGFVLVGSKYVKHIVDTCKSDILKLTGFEAVKIKRAKPAVDRNRDWAPFREEGLIK